MSAATPVLAVLLLLSRATAARQSGGQALAGALGVPFWYPRRQQVVGHRQESGWMRYDLTWAGAYRDKGLDFQGMRLSDDDCVAHCAARAECFGVVVCPRSIWNYWQSCAHILSSFEGTLFRFGSARSGSYVALKPGGQLRELNASGAGPRGSVELGLAPAGQRSALWVDEALATPDGVARPATQRRKSKSKGKVKPAMSRASREPSQATSRRASPSRAGKSGAPPAVPLVASLDAAPKAAPPEPANATRVAAAANAGKGNASSSGAARETPLEAVGPGRPGSTQPHPVVAAEPSLTESWTVYPGVACMALNKVQPQSDRGTTFQDCLQECLEEPVCQGVMVEDIQGMYSDRACFNFAREGSQQVRCANSLRENAMWLLRNRVSPDVATAVASAAEGAVAGLFGGGCGGDSSGLGKRIAGPKSLELRVIASQQLPDSWSAHLGFACFSAQGGARHIPPEEVGKRLRLSECQQSCLRHRAPRCAGIMYRDARDDEVDDGDQRCTLLEDIDLSKCSGDAGHIVMMLEGADDSREDITDEDPPLAPVPGGALWHTGGPQLWARAAEAEHSASSSAWSPVHSVPGDVRPQRSASFDIDGMLRKFEFETDRLRREFSNHRQ